MKTLTSWFVLASLAGYFVVLTVTTLANATFITLTSQPGDFVDAGTNQIFTGMYVSYAPVGSIAVLRS
jgi:hypothetical protein